jgi:RimJ/RimL family protein N-acetyltransferase
MTERILTRPVRTERLSLRPATAKDAEATFAYRRLESVGRWLAEIPSDLETYRATFTDNTTSWRLMERVGMRRETCAVRESLHRSGEWLDGYGYALLADEWRGA